MPQRPSTVALRSTLYEEACAVIADHYADDLQIEDVARRIATSRRQLQRCFDEVAGTSFREHLTTVRMQRAARMLAGTQEPVRAIAARVGYSQPAQFAKAFRRVHGMPPAEFRRRAQARGIGRRPEAPALQFAEAA